MLHDPKPRGVCEGGPCAGYMEKVTGFGLAMGRTGMSAGIGMEFVRTSHACV